MKKLFAIVLAIGLLLFIGRAESVTELSLTYVSRNSTASTLTTQVPVTTIIPGIHKIVGYQVMPSLDSPAGAWVSIYDSSARAQANIIGESEALTNTTDGEVWGYPKAVKAGGLTIVQSCHSTVFIEYTR